MVTWRRTAEGSGEKLRRIEAVTDAALSGLNLDDLLVELLERTRDLLATDTATVLLLDPIAKDLIATAAVGLEEEVVQGVRVPLGQGFAGHIAALAEPIILDHVDRSTVVNQLLIDKRLVSMAGVPMLAAGQVIGVLHVGSISRREFTDDDIALLRLVADRASLATQAQLSRLERQATLALQRSLLPARPPAVDGLDVATRYIPGAEVGVGGDWYDLFELPSGHVGVVVGDVEGSGLRAAVVMGRIRSALRAYALETTDPAKVLTRLDRKIQLFEPNAMATIIYVVINPSHTRAAVSTAGHLPPVIVDHRGQPRFLRPPVDLPVGAYPNALRRTSRFDVRPGSTMMLYTDGLIERRDRPIECGLELLLASARRPETVQDLCMAVTSRLLGDRPSSDDVAILAVSRMDD